MSITTTKDNRSVEQAKSNPTKQSQTSTLSTLITDRATIASTRTYTSYILSTFRTTKQSTPREHVTITSTRQSQDILATLDHGNSGQPTTHTYTSQSQQTLDTVENGKRSTSYSTSKPEHTLDNVECGRHSTSYSTSKPEQTFGNVEYGRHSPSYSTSKPEQTIGNMEYGRHSTSYSTSKPEQTLGNQEIKRQPAQKSNQAPVIESSTVPTTKRTPSIIYGEAHTGKHVYTISHIYGIRSPRSNYKHRYIANIKVIYEQ